MGEGVVSTLPPYWPGTGQAQGKKKSTGKKARKPAKKGGHSAISVPPGWPSPTGSATKKKGGKR
jgi:hypothetical protein